MCPSSDAVVPVPFVVLLDALRVGLALFSRCIVAPLLLPISSTQ